jgi:hypothetical protein
MKLASFPQLPFADRLDWFWKQADEYANRH